jgi:DnaJ-like protein
MSQQDNDKGIDAAIHEAMVRGDFDNLKGKGKPLNLDEYFNTPEDVRVGYSLLKSRGFVPEEVELLKEIKELKEKLAGTTDDAGRKKLQRAINDIQLKYDLEKDRFKGRAYRICF